MQSIVRAYFAVVNCFKPGHIPPICIDDLAVSEPLKSAYRRFKRLGKADKQGKVDAAGLARALRVKETPFLRKLLECWDRDGAGRIDFRELVVGVSEFLPAGADKQHDAPLRFAFRLSDQNDDGYMGRSDLEHLSDFMKTSDTHRQAPLGKLFADMGEAKLQSLDFSTYAVMVTKYPHMTAPVDPLWRALQPLSRSACELVRQLRLQGHIQFLEPAPMGRLAEPKRHLTVLKEQVTRSVQPLPRSRSPSPSRRLPPPQAMPDAAQGGHPSMGGGGHHHPQAYGDPHNGGGQVASGSDDRAWGQQHGQYPQHAEAAPQRSRSASPSRGMNVLMHSGIGRAHSPGGGFAMDGAHAQMSQTQRIGGHGRAPSQEVYLHDEGGAPQDMRAASPRRGPQLERNQSMPAQRGYGRVSPDPYSGPWLRDNPLAQWDQPRAGDMRSQSPNQRQGQARVVYGRESPVGYVRIGSLRMPSPPGRQPVGDADMVESVIAALGAGSSPRRQVSRALPTDYYAQLEHVARQRSPSPQF